MKKAVIALGHKLLVIVYNLLTTGEAYDENRFAEVQKRVDESKKMKLIAQARKYGLVLTDARGTRIFCKLHNMHLLFGQFFVILDWLINVDFF